MFLRRDYTRLANARARRESLFGKTLKWNLKEMFVRFFVPSPHARSRDHGRAGACAHNNNNNTFVYYAPRAHISTPYAVNKTFEQRAFRGYCDTRTVPVEDVWWSLPPRPVQPPAELDPYAGVYTTWNLDNSKKCLGPRIST